MENLRINLVVESLAAGDDSNVVLGFIVVNFEHSLQLQLWSIPPLIFFWGNSKSFK